MSAAFNAQLPLIGATSTLGWERDDIAQSYMRHIRQRIDVLLPRRGWRVGVLKEFYPRGAALLGLNVNAGAEVCVRFRVPGRKFQFLPFHEVLCTTLHEFAHCEISPHNSAFWNLYYELVREAEALEVNLISRGINIYPPHVSDPATTASAGQVTSPRHATPRIVGFGSDATRGGGVGAGRRGAPARGRGRGRGGITQTRGGGGSYTMTVRPPRGRGGKTQLEEPVTEPVDARPAPVAFDGAGQRLGGSATSSAALPVSDDERRELVAEAATRRYEQARALAATAPARVEEEQDEQEEASMDAEDQAASRPSLSEVAAQVAQTFPYEVDETSPDSDESWTCERCTYLNPASRSTCVMCSDALEHDEEVAQVCAVPAVQPGVKRERSTSKEDLHAGCAGPPDSPITISDDSDNEVV